MSDLITSDLITSDLITSDLITSDLITSVTFLLFRRIARFVVENRKKRKILLLFVYLQGGARGANRPPLHEGGTKLRKCFFIMISYSTNFFYHKIRNFLLAC